MTNDDIQSTPETDDENIFLELLKKHEDGVNNGTLRSELGWDETKYWSIRNRLNDSGRVAIRRGGPGGTTFIPKKLEIESAKDSSVICEDEASSLYKNESDLYDPMLRVLNESWVKDQGYDLSIVRITAQAGRRDTGGTWTRPDLCVVAIRKFKFLRDPVFDVISFEVKTGLSITVQGVFEALAHRQSTTRSYAIYHVSDKSFDDFPEAERITELAEQHGIGVILAENPNDYETWTERVRARRWTPDPDDLNDFLQRIFPSSDHDEIIKLAK